MSDLTVGIFIFAWVCGLLTTVLLIMGKRNRPPENAIPQPDPPQIHSPQPAPNYCVDCRFHELHGGCFNHCTNLTIRGRNMDPVKGLLVSIGCHDARRNNPPAVGLKTTCPQYEPREAEGQADE